MKSYSKFLILLLIFIFSIGAVCAHDLNQTDQSCVDGENGIGINDEDVLSDSSVKSFKDLNESMSDMTISEFNVTDDYAYDESDGDFPNGIVINKDNFVINGNNHVIDAKSKNRIFTVNGSNIIINNLVFKNGIDHAAVILGKNITTNNVTFINCSSQPLSSVGGAIYAYNSTYVSNNDRFIDNSADSATAIFSDSSDVTVYNASFENKNGISWSLIYASDSVLKVFDTTFVNITSRYATAIYSSASSVTVKKSKFINLFANFTAGAIAFKGYNDVLIEDCDFINVSSAKNGGAIFADLFDANEKENGDIWIINNLFDNCRSMFGGAILQLSGTLNITNCDFTNNYAEYNGGAVYISDVARATIANSIFENNDLGYYEEYPTYGGAVFCDYSALNMINSIFTNNSAIEGGAAYLYDSAYYLDELEFNDNYYNAISTYFDDKNSFMGDYYGNDVISKSDFNKTDYPNVVSGEGMQLILINQTNITDLPAVYDLRKLNLTTPVRDQGRMGSCWAFGMTATLESAVLKAFGLEADFSENNMQNSMLIYSKYGTTELREGGYNNFSSAYLLSWFGAFPKGYDDYDELGKISPLIRTDEDIHIQDIIFISHKFGDNESINNVKRAILKYGALDACIFSKASSDDGNSVYYNETTFAEYNPNHILSNHEVCVVGWNDNFSKDNFGVKPPGDGAWIVKNSWGTDWGDEGYFYVSYYDQTFSAFPEKINEGFTAIVLENTLPYNKNYQYDLSGLSRFFYEENGEMLTYFNVFEADEDDMIAAVGTYFDGEGIEYKIGVEVNDEEVYTQTGISPYCGFHTIKLDKYVSIRKGDKFLVSITSNAVPLCTNSRFKFEEMTSLIHYPNGNWEDLSSEGLAACLKVYTLPNTVVSPNKVTVGYNAKSNIKATFYDNEGNLLANTKVNVDYDGVTSQKTTDSNGVLTIAVTGNKIGTHTLKFTNPVTGDEVTTTIKVASRFSGNKNVNMYYFDGTTFTVKVYGDDGKLVGANQIIVIKLNKGTYKVKTNKNGVATLKIPNTVTPGTYTLTATYKGQTIKNTVKVKQVLTSKKTVTVKKSAKKFVLKATLKNGKKAVKNKWVTFKFNGKSYKAKTNAKGIAQVTIKKNVIKKLKKGKKYTVKVTYLKDTIKTTVKVK